MDGSRQARTIDVAQWVELPRAACAVLQIDERQLGPLLRSGALTAWDRSMIPPKQMEPRDAADWCANVRTSRALSGRLFVERAELETLASDRERAAQVDRLAREEWVSLSAACDLLECTAEDLLPLVPVELEAWAVAEPGYSRSTDNLTELVAGHGVPLPPDAVAPLLRWQEASWWSCPPSDGGTVVKARLSAQKSGVYFKRSAIELMRPDLPTAVPAGQDQQSKRRAGRPDTYPPHLVEKFIEALTTLTFGGVTYKTKAEFKVAWCKQHPAGQGENERTARGWSDAASALPQKKNRATK